MRTRLAIIAAAACAAVAPAHAGTVTANTSNPFDGAGVFVDNIENFPGPWGLAAELRSAHFSWIAFHAHNGVWTTWGTNAEWIAVMREHGLKVGLWGWEDSNPWLAANLAAFQVRSSGADFYIADAEWDYLRARHSAGWWRSRIFASTFRSLEPGLPAALTTFGAAEAPWVLPIDFAAWRENGFDLLPQAYFNQFPKVDRPAQTVAHALRAKWPLERVHPVIGVYRHYPAARYVPLLRAAGTTGYALFIGDQATPADYQALSVLNAAG